MVKYGEEVWGVTVELTLRFRQAVPLDVGLTAAGRIVKENRRLFEGTGEILLPDGTVAVEATGKYVKLAVNEIGEWDPEREEWYVRPD